MQLYRKEAIDGQRKRLHGSVTIHQPTSLKAITIGFLVVTGAAGVFLGTGSFSREEKVAGWIAPENGMAQISSPKSGAVTEVLVRVGQTVKAADPLAVISTDISGPTGDLAPQQRAMTQARIGELDRQLTVSDAKQRREEGRLTRHARALRADAAHLEQEKRSLQDQLNLAQRQRDEIQPLVKKGFIAKVESDRREQQVYLSQQAVTDMDRQIDAMRADASDLEDQARGIPAARELELSQLRVQREALEQNLAELQLTDRLVLRSPIHGRVAAISVRPGDSAGANVPLITVSAERGKLEAELMIPTRTAGFVAPGQRVRLAIDAFPSQRFGEIDGVIDTLGRAPLSVAPGNSGETKEAAYRATVALSSDHMRAYGRTLPLLPGMTLRASIVTSKRTFVEWLFDPVLSIGRDINH